MKEFIYLLNKEGVLLIVESAEEMPEIRKFEDRKMPFRRYNNWLSKATKYPCADKEQEHKFIDLAKTIKKAWNKSKGFESVLTAGIRIKSENVEIKEIRFWEGRKETFVNCAVYRPSPPLVIGGEETQDIDEEFEWHKAFEEAHKYADIQDRKDMKENNIPSAHWAWFKMYLTSRFHITRINQ